MRKRLFSWAASGLATLLLAIAPAVATAHSIADNGTSDSSVRQSREVTETEAEDTGDDHPTTTSARQKVQQRLEKAQLKVCQQREKRISSLLTSSSARAQKQLELFSTITTRVEEFYQKKGKTVANYDELVAAVDAAKSKATTDLATLQQSTTFRCDGENPKGTTGTFKTALQDMHQDLQDYRTALKALISGIRAAQGGSNE